MLDGNGDALAAGTPLPKRFGEFYWGNGVNIKSWYPSATGAGWQLTPLLMPLANVKSYVSVVSGTVVYIPYTVSGHMGSLQSITSGVLGTPQGGLNNAFAGPTMDVAIADADRHDHPLQVPAPRRRVDGHQRRRLRRARRSRSRTTARTAPTCPTTIRSRFTIASSAPAFRRRARRPTAASRR